MGDRRRLASSSSATLPWAVSKLPAAGSGATRTGSTGPGPAVVVRVVLRLRRVGRQRWRCLCNGSVQRDHQPARRAAPRCACGGRAPLSGGSTRSASLGDRPAPLGRSDVDVELRGEPGDARTTAVYPQDVRLPRSRRSASPNPGSSAAQPGHSRRGAALAVIPGGRSRCGRAATAPERARIHHRPGRRVGVGERAAGRGSRSTPKAVGPPS